MLSDRILFIDAEAMVLDKRAGLPVDAPRDGSISVANHLESLAFGFKRWPLPVHRLDRDTSGCLLLARNPKAHKRYQQAFESGAVSKSYLAIVDGVPADESGLIDMALGKTSTREAGWRIVPDPRGKPARTRWRRLQTIGNRSLLLMEPETGRTHQLRVHAASGINCPIAGDPVYGRSAGPMLLHAWKLHLPREGKADVFAEAPLPPSFIAAGFPVVDPDHAPA